MFEAVEGLSISSVIDESIYKRSSKGLSLLLQNTGGIGVITWYLNGEYAAKGYHRESLAIHIKQLGRYQLSAIDEQGNSDIVNFIVN